ncbi:hypothetical protein MBM_00233 [Drepanopeziza brunnea f. sp. 'multigermtubi' MB_m1]|uniref:Uncharacterized protein n=1 Tax=Marssonina brunnea f. sp. multigermtubi (strain MB_m1) TaxID=1072389 RepID=K1WU09_MARBU|nr:uncharacterized protein MBM_00233 [Drepanopeziza brunnea f. sp. 'multigermtubi' MB_m1]EKD21120.1 hypothetical protein MBM_00233 [Drepanopeziza brunnea f. sp. 'multigermtubi' MB_m1]
MGAKGGVLNPNTIEDGKGWHADRAEGMQYRDESIKLDSVQNEAIPYDEDQGLALLAREWNFEFRMYGTLYGVQYRPNDFEVPVLDCFCRSLTAISLSANLLGSLRNSASTGYSTHYTTVLYYGTGTILSTSTCLSLNKPYRRSQTEPIAIAGTDLGRTEIDRVRVVVRVGVKVQVQVKVKVRIRIRIIHVGHAAIGRLEAQVSSLCHEG